MTSHCDICKTNLQQKNYVDGKIMNSGWGTMCEGCHRSLGMGFGTGFGQLYNSEHKKIKG